MYIRVACGKAKRHIFCNSVRYFAHLHLDGWAAQRACSSNWPMQGPWQHELPNRQPEAEAVAVAVAVPGSLAVDNGPQRSAFITGAYETFDWRSQPNEWNARVYLSPQGPRYRYGQSRGHRYRYEAKMRGHQLAERHSLALINILYAGICNTGRKILR